MQRALAIRLTRLPGVLIPGNGDEPVRPDALRPVLDTDGPVPTVLVAPAPDLPVRSCRQATINGLRVIVLAPVPREREQLAYEDAGAYAYIPMSVDIRELAKRISALLPPGDGACNES